MAKKVTYKYQGKILKGRCKGQVLEFTKETAQWMKNQGYIDSIKRVKAK